MAWVGMAAYVAGHVRVAPRPLNAYVAATDPDWFEFLRGQDDVDEVNFWYPKP